MYGEFFGLRLLPFEDRADTEFTFLTPEFEETLAQLEFEGRFGNRSLLITGEAGIGKTQLIRAFLLRLHATDHAVVVNWPISGELDLIQEACKGFGVMLPSNGKSDRRLHRLQRHLSRTRQAGHCSVLVLDQAENLPRRNLAHLATLADLQDEGGKLLTIVLVGQPRVRALLEEPEFARLKQQLFSERVLVPLLVSQTGAYIRHRLAVAGAADECLFAHPAIEWIHRASQGVPRLINHLCHSAMIAAYGSGEMKITQDTLVSLAEAGPECERTMQAHDVGLCAAALAAPAMESITPRSSRRRQNTPSPRDQMSVAADGEERNAPASCGSETSGSPRVDGDEPGIVEPLTGSMGSLFNRGEALLERLERALSGADRVTVTTESSLTQFTAVEHHLTTLVNSAERVMAGLEKTTAIADGRLDQLQTVAEENGAAAADRTAQLDERITRAMQVAESLTNRLVAAERAHERSNVTDARLTMAADELTQKTEEVQRHISELFKGIRDTAEARSALQETIQSAVSARREQEAQSRTLHTELQSSIRCAEQLQERLNPSAIAKLKSEIENSAREAERSLRIGIDQLVEQGRGTSRDEHHAITESLQTIVADAKKEVRSATEGLTRQWGEIDELSKTLEGHVRERMEAQRKQIEHAANAVVDRVINELRGLSEHATETSANAEAALARVRTETQNAIRDWTRYEESTISREIEKMEAGLQEQWVACSRSHEQRLAAILAQHRTQVEAAVNETQPRLDALSRRIDEMVLSKDDLTDAVGTLNNQISAARANAHSIDDDLRRTLNAAENDRAQSAALAARLTAAVSQGESLFEGVQTVRGQLDELHRRFSADLNELVRAEERTRNLREDCATAENTGRALNALRDSGSKLADELKGHIEQGTQLEAAVALANRIAEENERRLASHNAAATHTLRELVAKTSIGRKAVDDVHSIAGDVERTIAEGRQYMSQWSETDSDRVRAVEQLAEWTASARRLHDELQTSLNQAAQSAGELTTQVAQAAALSDQLTAANETARTLNDQAVEITAIAQRASIECQEGILSRIAKGCLVNAKAETLAAEIDGQLIRAAEISTRLIDGIQPTERLLAEITVAMGDAQNRLSELRAGSLDVGAIVEQLHGLEHLVLAIQGAEETVGRSVESARTIQEGIATLMATAEDYAGRLETLQAKSVELVAEHEKVNDEGQVACRQLSEHVVTGRNIIESGNAFLRNVVDQCETVEARVLQLAEQAARIEHSLTDAASQPAAAVEAAKAQIAQLNKVCAAVRKVFAGLSQATLEARERTSDLQSIQRETGVGLATLLKDTERASHTLQEWVQEAIQAQERLERTLHDCSSLGEIHSRDRLLGLARTATTLGTLRERLAVEPLIGVSSTTAIGNDDSGLTSGTRNPESLTTDRSLLPFKPRGRIVDARQAVDHTATRQDTVSKHQERAAEIAQMIEEAKQAAGTR